MGMSKERPAYQMTLRTVQRRAVAAVRLAAAAAVLLTVLVPPGWDVAAAASSILRVCLLLTTFSILQRALWLTKIVKVLQSALVGAYGRLPRTRVCEKLDMLLLIAAQRPFLQV
jgi:hypothetical protein